MSETQHDLADDLREALRSLREETPANQMARASILAAVHNDPAMYAVALEETAYPQAELDLHLEDEIGAEHETRADWFGHFVARFSSAVNEVTKSMAHKKRNTPGLRVLAPAPGSVRVVLRAPLPSVKTGQTSIEGTDDTSAESRALSLVTALLKMSEQDTDDPTESPFTAATQTLSPMARQRVRSIAKSVIDADWEVRGELFQRGHTLEEFNISPRAAKRLYDELNRTEVIPTSETLQGTIDGQRHSLSTMWFIPDGSARAIEVAITDIDLLDKVTRLSAINDLRVECRFAVYLIVPAGASQAASRSRELESIEPIDPLPDQ